MTERVPALSADSVRLEYMSRGRKVPVLEDFSLHVDPSEFLCIVGPSGCGKSTFLNLVAGLKPAYPPRSGQIYVYGKRVTGPGRERMMVFQSHAVFPWLNVRENVGFALRAAHVPSSERKAIVDHYLQLVGLQEFASAFPHELSGGMKQRVGLARALVTRPALLLMDEPFASVDALTRKTLQQELRRIWDAERRTVVFVTHSIEEALVLGTRILVLSNRPACILMDRSLRSNDPTVPHTALDAGEAANLTNEIESALESHLETVPISV